MWLRVLAAAGSVLRQQRVGTALLQLTGGGWRHGPSFRAPASLQLCSQVSQLKQGAAIWCPPAALDGIQGLGAEL